MFFRHSYSAPISPSPSSVSSRSLTSPIKPLTLRRKSVTKIKKPSESIIKKHEALNVGHKTTGGVPVTSSYDESSDDYYGVASESDITRERYRDDAKLLKRCAVVITPSKEILQYQRKQNQMYNEILKMQRRKLELRALEKQLEKERRRVGRREEIQKDQSSAVVSDQIVNNCRRTRNYHEIFMSSESEYETTFQVRSRKQKTQNLKDLEPLKIQIDATENTTTTLLSQIDAHLDQTTSGQSFTSEIKQKHENPATNYNSYQQTCDISTDKSNTKMRELNLLADIAQHLSPYQLDIPENNPPRSPSYTPEPSSITKAAPQTAGFREVPKEKIIVTEQLFLQSIDNLLENRIPQLDNNHPQKQASSSYAHEPKLNKAAIFKSSPCTNQQINNTQSEKQNNDNPREEQIPQTQIDETLEQIIQESFSVLTESNPCNSLKERDLLRKESTIPILISNVESLNQFAQNDIAKQNSEIKVHLLGKNTTNSESQNVVLAENLSSRKKEKNCNTKDVIDLSFKPVNNVETPIMCHTDLINISRVRHISQTFNVAPITAADLSRISLECEITKHLPEIAEPSPVVTDMSNRSDESNVSKSFNNHYSNVNNYTTSSESNHEMSMLDLSMVMPNLSQQDCIQNNFNQYNNTLNTPIKHSSEMSKETQINRSATDLNTPLKYALQNELENNSIPLKNGLEPELETDNNVTQFLDLILNKTVTEAESETRDKIIKELNALTAEATVAAEMRENTNNSEKVQSETGSEEPVEANNTVIKKNYKEIDLRQQISFPTDTSKLDKTIEYNERFRQEKNSSDVANSESEALKEYQLQTPSANIEINLAKANFKDVSREIYEIKTTELSDALPLISLRHTHKQRRIPVKQTYNIKCRVRLKRLNVDDFFKNTKMQSLPPISTAKATDLQSFSNHLTECDVVAAEKIVKIKKSCLKTNNKHANKEQNKITDTTAASEVTTNKKPKFDSEKSLQTDAIKISESQTSDTTLINNTTIAKPKSKPLKTVTFDLSNLNEELRDNTISNHKQKLKSNAAGALGCFLKSSKASRKLPDNTLRAAETLQMYVNTINASTRTPPPAQFNKKRNPIKNKCIAEDETPRPPPASTLMGNPPCKKSCTEKLRSNLTSKCKDQLVSSLTTSAIPSITSDITTARIYTSSPLDQTLPEYDDNVDTVANSELILPTTTGSLRRKLKRPKKTLTRPEPTDDVNTDDIVNPPDCNGEDDTDAVVDNEDDVFPQELLPIPAANDNILEEIVSARPTHIGTSTGIRDDYMNIEATATVPVYLFNDESRELGSPEVIQSSDYTNVVDSSSYLNSTSTTTPANIVPTSASTTSTTGNLEKSMLSPSEHEVSSTQETFYQTPTKNKQTEIFGEKSSTSKAKGNTNSGLTTNAILKQKSDDNKLKKTVDYQFSSTVGLLQNNQVDTTNHSPEMCTVALTSTTTTTTLANNRKIRKASTHDEILFNELQQQLPSRKRKSNSATFCVESTSDNSNKPNQTKVSANNLDDTKSNRSLAKVDDKFKKLLNEVCKVDKDQSASSLDEGLTSADNNTGGGGEGGSSPSTTTTINEESLTKSKRKKLKSSKSKKNKNRSEKSSKISLKPSKLTPRIPANPLIITISKSRLLRPSTSPRTSIESQNDQQQSDFSNIPNANLFSEKIKGTVVVPATAIEKTNPISLPKKEITQELSVVNKKSNSSETPGHTLPETDKIAEPNTRPVVPHHTSSTPTAKEDSGASAQTIKKHVSISNTTTCTKNSNNFIFAKDKYDLIKSKEKHHTQQNQEHDRQDNNKDKSKEKAIINLKSLTSIISCSPKGSNKEKVKGEKSKDKHKNLAEKSLANKTQSDNVPKIAISQNNMKSYPTSSFLANFPSTTPLFSSNTKQSNIKSSKSNSPTSSSSVCLPISAILKSKTNSSTTHLSDVAATTGPSHTTAATLSTNNVRKKLKIK